MNTDSPPTYDEAKEMASHSDASVRQEIASREDVSPEILYFLASDENPDVRRTVAQNMSTPRQVHEILARDDDEGVRTDIAEKLMRIAPHLSDDERDQLRQSMDRTLNILARDQITKVRKILSDTLKDIANAPPEVIKQLALDSEITVSSPVLEFSPVLTDDDLIEIIQAGPASGGLNAISKRQNVAEVVADAIVETDDIHAIADLLGNDTAQIREETLDDLINRSDKVELWQAPLVSRPKLPSGAASRLANFVAENLLETLTGRHDMDAATLEAVKSTVHQRLGASGGNPNDSRKQAVFLKDESSDVVAMRMQAAGTLDSVAIEDGIKRGDEAFVAAAIALVASIDDSLVKKILSSQNPKAIVSLAWKTHLPMSVAIQLQQRVGRVPPDKILQGGEAETYPLSDEEMDFQIKYFTERMKKQIVTR